MVFIPGQSIMYDWNLLSSSHLFRQIKHPFPSSRFLGTQQKRSAFWERSVIHPWNFMSKEPCNFDKKFNISVQVMHSTHPQNRKVEISRNFSNRGRSSYQIILLSHCHKQSLPGKTFLHIKAEQHINSYCCNNHQIKAETYHVNCWAYTTNLYRLLHRSSVQFLSIQEL